MMWDTSMMFNNFRRRFLPDFWNFDLGFMDTPFTLGNLETRRRPHRSRRHRRTRDIVEPQKQTQQAAESGLKSGGGMTIETEPEKGKKGGIELEKSEREKMSGVPEVEIKSETIGKQ